MFWTMSVLFIVVWLMTVVTGYTFGGAVHVLPVAAVICALLGGLKRHHGLHEPHFGDPRHRGSH